MTPITARWLPYGLPLHRPWESASGRVEARRGYLLRLDAADGRCGWGDCAPLAEAGIDDAAATRHAENCAVADLAAQAAGQSLSAWLAAAPVALEVPVNAALGAVTAVTVDAVQAACAAGFTTLKLKVGCAPLAVELPRLQAITDALPPGISLRLDANGAWDEVTALNFLHACRALPVEAMEEPLRAPTLAGLGRLQAATGITLALDESLPRLPLADILALRPVRRLVLKPARHGGLKATLALAREAQAAGFDCVVTSALESACGLLAAAHLAAAVAPGNAAPIAHGLGTAGWFVADTGTPPVIANGHLRLPDSPGLGFVPALS